jgi:hypothetical protein
MQIYGTDPDEVRLGRLVDDEDPLFKRMRLFHFGISTIYVDGATRKTRQALDYVTRIEPGRRYTHEIEAIGGTGRTDFEEAVRTVARTARVRSGRTKECVVYSLVADLPRDSTASSRRSAMVTVETQWRSRGYPVLWVIHKPAPGDTGNWHAHLFLTARRARVLSDGGWEVDRFEPAALQKVWKRKQARAEYSQIINTACRPKQVFFPGTKFQLCKQRGKLRLPQWLLPLRDRSEAAIQAAAPNRRAGDYAVYVLRWNDLIRLKRDPLEDSWIRARRQILRDANSGAPSPPALSPLPPLPPAAPPSRAVQPPAATIPKHRTYPKPAIAQPVAMRPATPKPTHAPKPKPMPKPRAEHEASTTDEVLLNRIDTYIDRLGRREGEHRLDFEKRLRQTPTKILEDAVQTLSEGLNIARKRGLNRPEVKEVYDIMTTLHQTAYRALQIQLSYRKKPDRDDCAR